MSTMGQAQLQTLESRWTNGQGKSLPCETCILGKGERQQINEEINYIKKPQTTKVGKKRERVVRGATLD